MAPEAPSKCLILDFVELIHSYMYSNKTMNVFVEQDVCVQLQKLHQLQ
jgi:hypothetical protein